ncbi:MAG TPA: AAA family ATPase [Actinomycetes bacterium]|nr:AAA family ATPase [Actinomycetes bacterium]
MGETRIDGVLEYMPDLDIRVLGPVELRLGGEPETLRAQEATVLAMLVAAGGPVDRQALVDALWPSGWDRGLLSPVVSRLRNRLKGSGATISGAKGSHQHQLVFQPGVEAATVLDWRRFVGHAQRGHELLDAGLVKEALARFHEAAREWRGDPYSIPRSDWGLPEVCLVARDRLEWERERMVQRWAEAAARHGHIEETLSALPGRHGTGEDGERRSVWLLRFLAMLEQGQGADAQVELDEYRKSPHADAELSARAFWLLSMWLQGVAVLDVPAVLGTAGLGREDPPLVGRGRELAALHAYLDSVAGRAAPVLSIHGAGGMGKTRLLAELHRIGRARGIRVLRVTCPEVGGGLEPWRVLAGPLWAEALRDLRARDAAWAASSDNPLSDLVVPGEQLGRLPPGLGDERRLDLLAHTLRQVLLQAAADRPLVVAFDNAHWMSPVARRLLRTVRLRLRDAAVGFVLAVRHATRGPAEQKTGPTGGLPGDEPPPVEVGPLGQAEVRAWLAHALHREPSDGEVARVWRQTGGIPLLLQRQVRVEPRLAGTPAAADAASPSTGTIQETLRRCEPEVQAWLEAAAVISAGQELDPVAVAEVLRLAEGDADRRLAAAVSAGIVHGLGPLRFRHDLWRDAILDGLERSPARARHLHARAFQVLREQASQMGLPDRAWLVPLARHAVAGRPEVDDHSAAAACLDAARAERQGYSFENAIELAGRGLSFARGPQQRFELTMVLGDALDDGGDMSGAGRAYRGAHELAGGKPHQQAEATLRLARRWSDPGRVDQELTGSLERDLRALDGAVDEQAVLLRAQLSAYLSHKLTLAVTEYGELVDGLPVGVNLARNALAALDKVKDPAVRCEILTESRWGLYDFQSPRESYALAAQLNRESITAGSTRLRTEALNALVVDLLRLGRVTDAAQVVEEHRALAERSHRPLSLGLQSTFDTLLDLWRGDFAAAERRLGGFFALVSELEESHALPADTLAQTWTGQIYWLYREQGRMGELAAMDVVERAQRRGYFPVWRAALALVSCETDRYDQAVEEIVELLNDFGALEAFPPHGWAVPALALLAEACDLLHSAAAEAAAQFDFRLLTERLQSLLAPHLEELTLAGWPVALVGPVARSAGLVALASGDPGGALDLFDGAARLAGSARPQRARLSFDQARAWLRLGATDARSRAESLLRRSLREAESLGMARLAAQAEELLTSGHREMGGHRKV